MLQLLLTKSELGGTPFPWESWFYSKPGLTRGNEHFPRSLMCPRAVAGLWPLLGKSGEPVSPWPLSLVSTLARRRGTVKIPCRPSFQNSEQNRTCLFLERSCPRRHLPPLLLLSYENSSNGAGKGTLPLPGCRVLGRLLHLSP